MHQKERDLKKRSKTIFEVIKKTLYYYAHLDLLKIWDWKQKILIINHLSELQIRGTN